MIRKVITPRVNWKETVEGQGFLFHTADGAPYWDESAYYQFTAKQVDVLEAATNELHQMCLDAVQNVIDNKRYAELHIPESAIPLIEKSWNEEMPSIYGRFDLSYDGINPPKMLEYNADTPTSLLEAGVIQWEWMESVHNGADQFNSIHDKLIAKWKDLKDYLHYGPLYFSSVDTLEDYMNITYLRDTANQAGIETKELKIDDIGWDSKDNKFVDLEMYSISNVFKLYPWEWLLHETYGPNIALCFDKTFWIEPPWKMILSNKGILPILWELNPNHPNLLPAYFDQSKLEWYVKKPFYSREGANITMVADGAEITSSTGEYGEEGYIYQDLAMLPKFDDNYAVIGSWVIDGESAGIGIRESKSLITDNMSRFVPHIIK